jgi:hypothetical protein
MTTSLGQTADGASVDLNLDELIGSHLGVVANSGGGKSGLLRRLLETTAGRVQQIILDGEDEFYTLRERHEFVIAGGEGGDIPAPLASAESLALGALTHGFSLIAQLNDLGPDGAPEFVGRFLTALVNAPRDLWHPVLVVVDEVQRFAPRVGTTEATEGIRALLFQGRKRGFTAVIAGTKFTEIDPGVRGMVNNWMLGRVGQAVDRNTMAEQLGFTAKEGRDRLRGIEKRQFYAMGEALTREPTLFRVADVETTPVHAGQAKVPTPPAPEALREILAGLTAAPTDAAEGAAIPSGGSAAIAPITDAERAELVDLRRERDHWTIERAKGQRQLDALIAEGRALRDCAARIVEAAADMARIRPALDDAPPQISIPSEPAEQSPPVDARPQPAARAPSQATRGGHISVGPVSAPIMKLLNAVAWWNAFGLEAPTSNQVGFIADYAPTGGTFKRYRGDARTRGLISYPGDGRLALTDEGRKIAQGPDAPPTIAALHAAVRENLDAPLVKLLDPILTAYPRAIAADEVGRWAGHEASGGTFKRYRGTLKTLEIIEYPSAGMLRAADWLFPGENA